MPTISGDLGDLVGDPLNFPNGQPARAYLSPTTLLNIEGTELRVGGIQVTLDTGTAFSVDVPGGDYQLLVYYYDQTDRAPKIASIPMSA